MTGPFLICASIFTCIFIDSINRKLVEERSLDGLIHLQSKSVYMLVKNQRIFLHHKEREVDFAFGLKVLVNPNLPEIISGFISTIIRRFSLMVNQELRINNVIEGSFVDFVENDNDHIKVLIDERTIEIVNKERIYFTPNNPLLRLIQYHKRSKIENPIMITAGSAIFLLPPCFSHILPSCFIYLWCFLLLILFFGVILILTSFMFSSFFSF
jgi:hypothetical protein